ncbi:hypothetical protein [Rhodococcus sp. IEGM 1318]|uniref:hypothetical protein n=1 Tax=Rhodococcus sp. IEGM 1318 TaxID=3082226 RepID=UPI0029553180|nr:hypothetical protein [Rhodococcus sp. IEGM 1318]MDV8006734.1 hypothetical protein [Rhodococcus sp. IEGM 1318]
MPQPPDEVVNSPWVLYATIAFFVVTYAVAVSRKLQEFLGPFGRWITSRQERSIERERARRVAEAALDDVVVRELKADIADIGAQMRAQRRRHNEDLTALRREYDRRIADIRTEYDGRIEEMKSAHEREVRGHIEEMTRLRNLLQRSGGDPL